MKLTREERLFIIDRLLHTGRCGSLEEVLHWDKLRKHIFKKFAYDPIKQKFYRKTNLFKEKRMKPLVPTKPNPDIY